MKTEELLKLTVAEIFQTEPANIGPDFVLWHRRFQGSVGRGILDAAIRRRMGVTCPAVYKVVTFGELEAAVLGKEVPAAKPVAPAGNPAVAAPQSPVPSMRCGVDIEMVDNLPVVDDYWSADFYRAHFCASEIAYCVAKENPRMHFAARWCAKESLKKCDAGFLPVPMNELEVRLDAAGHPSLFQISSGTERRINVAVSLTHTPLLAAAIVVAGSGVL